MTTMLNRIRLLLGLFLLSSGPGCDEPGPSPPDRSESISQAEQAEVRAFWRTYRAANQARLRGDFVEAAMNYRTALESNPQHEDALYYLGNVLLEMGEYEAALRAWQTLREVAPMSARAHRRIGDVFACLEEPSLVQLDSAEASYRRAFEINKEETGSLIRLGEVALMQGRHQDALAYFDAVSRSNEESSEALLLGGYVLWATGDVEGARDRFDAARAQAKPAPAPGTFSGEGDTRSGAPMTRSLHACRPFHDVVEGLSEATDPQRVYLTVRQTLSPL